MEHGRVGIVGGGQLGRMLTDAALPLGFAVTVIDPVENCPAAQAGAEQIQASLKDPDAIRSLASRTDVVTWEIEDIDVTALEGLPTAVEPSPYTLGTIQDKLRQKRMLVRAGLPVAAFMDLDPNRLDRDVDMAFKAFGAVIIKARTGGYDGRGNMSVRPDNSQGIFDRFGDTQLYVERLVPFQKELAVIVARDVLGNIAQYPVVETIHENNICHLVLAPAGIDPRIRADAEEIAHETAGHLDGAGVFAIEMFLTDGDELLINEIAPRVHNSGHHTIEANATSQFEQHIRAITRLPLGSTEMISPAAMINILGERNGPVALRGLGRVLSLPGTHVHLYGKEPTKMERKMGHIVVISDDVEEARVIALKARRELTI
ncbi:MAG TPA: 5-(carboxyamino)imidazole ribonucleotide synthase [Candidatus Saccharimonadales bacterium]|nr:5-(carboxyamino)imidazole ribonucleotide synthase [Candidatus Saccharimonadales bacterium]